MKAKAKVEINDGFIMFLRNDYCVLMGTDSEKKGWLRKA